MKRVDGRKPSDMRPIEITAGVIDQADGSAMVKMGRTTAVAAVYGPKELHPRRMQKSEKAFIRTIYRMVPFSTTDRCRPGPNRRSQEISMVIRECIEPAVFVNEFPKKGIYLHIDIIQADAGTRTAAINAASVALADAGIPMRDLVTSVAAGKIGKDYFLDLEYHEEEETDADIPIAYMPRLKKITLLQMDVEHEIDQRPLQTRTVVDEQGEAGPAHAGRALELQNLQFCTQLPVWFDGKVGLPGFSPGPRESVVLLAPLRHRLMG